MPSLSLSLLLKAMPLFQSESCSISMPNCLVLSGLGYFTREKFLLDIALPVEDVETFFTTDSIANDYIYFEQERNYLATCISN